MPCENAALNIEHLCIDLQRKVHSKSEKNEPSEKKEDQDRPWIVLIVEDEMLVAEDMKEILVSAGYIVPDLLSTGDDVVAKYSLLNPDLIIMDVKLPGKMDGVEAASVIHMSKQIPIIFLTAHSSDQFDHISFLSKESYRYINKPFDLRKMPEFIQKFRIELKDRPIPHNP
jgi:DNA-binding response OmpR family regulator